MSVYSGFGTRKEEEVYNKMVYNLLFVLQLRVERLYTSQQDDFTPNSSRMSRFDDPKLQRIVAKFYAKMCQMEETKYLAPKFSRALKDLAKYLGIY